MSDKKQETDTGSGPRRRSRERIRLTRWLGGYLGIALAVFVLGAVVGAGLIQLVSLDALSQFAAGQSFIPAPLTVGFIFRHNLIAVTITLGGVLTFGVLSIISLFMNGLHIGVFLGVAVGNTTLVVLAAWLLPHGIFELPAFWLAGAIGVRVAHRLVRYLRGTDERILTQVEVIEVVLLVIGIVVLLAIAAWIEVNVTPVIAERVGA